MKSNIIKKTQASEEKNMVREKIAALIKRCDPDRYNMKLRGGISYVDKCMISPQYHNNPNDLFIVLLDRFACLLDAELELS